MPEEGSRVRIEGARDGDLAEILRDFERFWGDGGDLVRHLHHPMFFLEFRDTAYIARDLDNGASVAFHERLGFTEIVRADDYGGSGRPRVVMRKPVSQGVR